MEEPRVWKNRSKTCTICDKKFRSPFVRRHHCRHCGNSVCNSCSPHREILPQKGYTEPVRVCSKCFKKLTVSRGTQRPKSDKRVPLEELAKHNTADDAWVAIKGEVFDVTEFIKHVPCGNQILQHAGGIADGTFDKAHGHGIDWINKLIPYYSHKGALEVSREHRKNLSLPAQMMSSNLLMGANNTLSVRHISRLERQHSGSMSDVPEALTDEKSTAFEDDMQPQSHVKVYINGKWRRGVFSEPAGTFAPSDNMKYDVEVNSKPSKDSTLVVTERVSVARDKIFWPLIRLEHDVARSVKTCLQHIERIREKTMQMNAKCDTKPTPAAGTGSSASDPLILFSSWCKVHDQKSVNWTINSNKLKRVVKNLYDADDGGAHYMSLKANGVLSYSVTTRSQCKEQLTSAGTPGKSVLEGPQEYAVLTGQCTASVYSQGVVVLSLPDNIPPLERKIVFQVLDDDANHKTDNQWKNGLEALVSVQHYRSYVSMQYAASLLARADTSEAVADGVVAGAADSLRQLSTQRYSIYTGNILECSILAPKLFTDLRYRYFLRARKAKWLREKLVGSTAPLPQLSNEEGYRLSEAQFIKSMSTLRKFDDTGGGRSGADFLISEDERYMLKTMSKAESSILYRLLPYYTRHMELNPSSLIVPFLGVFYVTDTFVENSDLADESGSSSIFQPVADESMDPKKEEEPGTISRRRKVTVTKYLCMANIFFDTDGGVRKVKKVKKAFAHSSRKVPDGISVSSSDLDQSPKRVGVQVLDPGAPTASTSADTQTTTVDQPTESATLDTSNDTEADENNANDNTGIRRISTVADFVKRILKKAKKRPSLLSLRREVLKVFSYQLWEKSKAQIEVLLEEYHLRFSGTAETSKSDKADQVLAEEDPTHRKSGKRQLTALHQIFDLKGSTVARLVKPKKAPAKPKSSEEAVIKVPVLKDQNFLDVFWPSQTLQHGSSFSSVSSDSSPRASSDSNTDQKSYLESSPSSARIFDSDTQASCELGGLHLKPALRERLIRQIAKDSKFLADHFLMDYSLLLGIHQVEHSKRFPEDDKTSLLLPLQSSDPFWLGDNPRLREQLGKRRQHTYYIGIIDVLQKYDIMKQAERIAKKIKLRVTGTLRQLKHRSAKIDTNISSTNAPAYCARFLSFIAGRIFPKLEAPRFQLPCHDENERQFLLNCLRHHKEVLNQMMTIEDMDLRPPWLADMDPTRRKELISFLRPAVSSAKDTDVEFAQSPIYSTVVVPLKEACVGEFSLTAEQVDDVIDWLLNSALM